MAAAWIARHLARVVLVVAAVVVTAVVVLLLLWWRAQVAQPVFPASGVGAAASSPCEPGVVCSGQNASAGPADAT